MARSKTAQGTAAKKFKFHQLESQTVKQDATAEPKRLKFHNVYFDKVMKIKECPASAVSKTSSRLKGTAKKPTDLIIKEYDPERKKKPIKKENPRKEENIVMDSISEDTDELDNPLDLTMPNKEATKEKESVLLRLGSPPPLEPVPVLPKVSRPFAEAFMWSLLCKLRQEETSAQQEEETRKTEAGNSSRTSIPSG